MSNQMKRELEEFRALILRLESDGTNIKDIVDKLVDHQKDIMANLADMDKILQTIPNSIEKHNNYALADFLALLIAFSATSAGASTMSA